MLVTRWINFHFVFLLQLGFFTYYTAAKGEVNPSGPVPIDSVFIYRPDKRLELWRFAFYMFLHAGWVSRSMRQINETVQRPFFGIQFTSIYQSERYIKIFNRVAIEILSAKLTLDEKSLSITRSNKLPINIRVAASFRWPLCNVQRVESHTATIQI